MNVEAQHAPFRVDYHHHSAFACLWQDMSERGIKTIAAVLILCGLILSWESVAMLKHYGVIFPDVPSDGERR